MPLMLSELYTALVDAGASTKQASKAAAEVAQFENRLATMDSRLVQLDGRVSLLQWMVGTSIGLTLLGFSLLANWVWQILQRLPRVP